MENVLIIEIKALVRAINQADKAHYMKFRAHVAHHGNDYCTSPIYHVSVDGAPWFGSQSLRNVRDELEKYYRVTMAVV